MSKKSHTHKKGFFRNIRPSVIVLILPIATGITVAALMLSGVYISQAAGLRSKRIMTPGYEFAAEALLKKQPIYERKFAYYEVREGQTLQQIADYFSVDVMKLAEMNPGSIVAGTTLKIPPVEKPLPVKASTGTISKAVVIDDKGLLRISNEYSNQHQEIVTTIPELATFLAPYNAISKVSDKVYRFNRPFSIDGNIRLEMSNDTVTKLELESNSAVVTCLCGDRAIFDIKHVVITSVDSSVKLPDKDIKDGRAFVRMKNGRMDITDSDMSYLGNGLRKTLNAQAAEARVQQEGGVYGVSWRISDDKLGKEIATGWVENTKFSKNHFGAFTYGASGIQWRGNLFEDNEVYGLDPHDDSNNALIENNVFRRNGTHGFIVSKRCNFNIIRNNTSYNNGLHGFMLHQDSAYNIIEDNVSYGNVDNFAIYESNYNTIKGNKSYSPKSSHVRINSGSKLNYVIDNEMYGGKRNVYLYGTAEYVYIGGNKMIDSEKELQTKSAGYVVVENNVLENLFFDIDVPGRVIFGENTVVNSVAEIPTAPPLPKGYTLE